MQICDAIHQKAFSMPDKIALKEGDHCITYAELSLTIRQIASELLENGVKPGDLVALHLKDGFRHVVAKLGVIQCGAAACSLRISRKADNRP